MLETIEENGGTIRPEKAYEELADRIGLSREQREAETKKEFIYGSGMFGGYKQAAKRDGLIENPEFNLWRLTEKADKLMNAKPGFVITIYETKFGMTLWATAESALGQIRDNSIQLVLTSPPYPLLRPKEYGNLDERAYVDWLVDISSEIKRVLKEDGSFVLNLGNVYQRGIPAQSLYMERLLLKLCDEVGFYLAQKFFWYNNTKLPAPAGVGNDSQGTCERQR